MAEETHMHRRHHDMGGLDAGPIDRHEHDHAPWEKQTDAIMRLLVAKGVMTVDELRRGIEELGPGAYDAMSYYERWISSITGNLLEKRILDPAEIGRTMDEVRHRHETA
ncbi:MAG: nitrile hydratase subunit beta [Geminicoccaceae bacterium]|nr:nitrile hydratase subunit beta [Geminicoccaceae bacterium]